MISGENMEKTIWLLTMEPHAVKQLYDPILKISVILVIYSYLTTCAEGLRTNPTMSAFCIHWLLHNRPLFSQVNTDRTCKANQIFKILNADRRRHHHLYNELWRKKEKKRRKHMHEILYPNIFYF